MLLFTLKKHNKVRIDSNNFKSFTPEHTTLNIYVKLCLLTPELSFLQLFLILLSFLYQQPSKDDLTAYLGLKIQFFLFKSYYSRKTQNMSDVNLNIIYTAIGLS